MNYNSRKKPIFKLFKMFKDNQEFQGVGCLKKLDLNDCLNS